MNTVRAHTHSIKHLCSLLALVFWFAINLAGANFNSVTFSKVTVGPIVNFANAAAWSSYRVLFPTVRDAAAANSMQIAEVELLDAGGNDVTAPGDPVTPTSANSPSTNICSTLRSASPQSSKTAVSAPSISSFNSATFSFSKSRKRHVFTEIPSSLFSPASTRPPSVEGSRRNCKEPALVHSASCRRSTSVKPNSSQFFANSFILFKSAAGIIL